MSEYAVDSTQKQPIYEHPVRAAQSLFQQRKLILILIRRDVEDRYRGSLFGVVWSFLHPLLLLATYTYVFVVIFGASWPGMENRRLAFAVMLFCGLLPFNMLAEVTTKSCQAILTASSFVKRITFPLEVLPVVPVGSAAVHLVIGLAVLAIGQLIVIGNIPPTFLLIPFVLVPFVLVLLAASYFLACVGIFFRDVSHIINVGLTVLLFISPVLYPQHMAPPEAGVLLVYNPLAYVAQELRAVAVHGQLPSLEPWVRHMVMAVVLYCVSVVLFQVSRTRFADVL